MKAILNRWYANHKNVINTTKYLVVSLLLLVVVWLFDVSQPDWYGRLPQVLLLSAETSKQFLTTLAGVFLTVATFTFTTILTVMTTYSSSFTPRVVQRFISKPHVLSLIGIFIGGFFYAVLSLFVVQAVPSDKRLLAGTLGVLYAIASMIEFMRFVQRVIRDIRIVNVIQDIYDEACELVEKEVAERKQAVRLSKDDSDRTIAIKAHETGYFYDLNVELLRSRLADVACELVIDKKIGEYVAKGVQIADLHLLDTPGKENDAQDEKAFSEDIASCFLFNKAKNDTRDYHHELALLVEIALRAISPAVNDPNTAINCIGKISSLLGQLFATENHFIVMRDSEHATIVYKTYSIEEELYLNFYQLIHYGKDDPSVQQAVLEGIYLIFLIADDSAKESVGTFFDYAYGIFLQHAESDLDQQHLRAIKIEYQKKIDERQAKTG